MIPTSIIALIILAVTLFLFITELLDSALVAVLSCFAFVLFGVCSFGEAFSGFSNSIVILVFGMMVIGDAVFESGLAKKIASVISRLAFNNELLVMVYSAIVSGLLSMWLSNTAVIALFLAILKGLCSNKKYNEMNLTLPIAMGAMFGGALTLVGTTSHLTVQSIMLEMAGYEYGMFEYLPVGLILFGVYLAFIVFIGRPLGRRIWGNRSAEEIAAAQGKHVSNSSDVIITEEDLTGKQKLTRKEITMLILMICMIVLFIIDVIPVAMIALTIAFASIITGCTKFKHALKNTNWEVLIRLAGCLGIASALTASGATEIIADVFIKVTGDGMSPRMVLFISLILITLLSNFITNSTAILILIPIVIPIVQALGYSPIPYGLAISYMGSLVFLTPLANAQTGMTMVAGYKFNDYFKYNILLEIFTFLVVFIFVPVFFPF